MKSLLRKLAAPILTPLENSSGAYEYQRSHRTVLYIMGVLFLLLASIGLYFSLKIEQFAGLFPVTLFGLIGLICLIVAWVGSDKAVAKIWRNRNETYSK
ncbi:hypothetical protein THMIRHAS_02180 [Thiosulfatimonas sediminis]|uniref:Uncharacterized protein n=1 Tax=Thiosulfatimonas sediminis TaxID=2675054 RepID=A0A6F8PRV2_9GAMM|nr:hypothetical protein [Thiosulfatimonas sediminis]BBP44845.1 hypothetical protein THMIRHAS_02180 [Thiosulfatimonas sediminis]